MEETQKFDESSLEELNNLLKKGDIQELLIFLNKTGWTINELKIDNTDERSIVTDEEGIQSSPILNLITFTNTMTDSATNTTYVYEFKIHEEHDIFRAPQKFNSDKEWTCQIARRKVFNSSEATNFINTISSTLKQMLNINQQLDIILDKIFFKDPNKRQAQKNAISSIFNPIRTCSEIAQSKIEIQDEHNNSEYYLKYLLTSKSLTDAHKNFANHTFVIKDDTITQFLNKMERFKKIYPSFKDDFDNLSENLSHLYAFYNDNITQCYVTYLENNGNWSTNRNTAETHHVIKHPDFKTTPGLKYDYIGDEFLIDLYRENREYNIIGMISLATENLISRCHGTPEKILEEIKSYDGSDKSIALKNLSKIYSEDPLLVEKALCQKLIIKDFTSLEGYLTELNRVKESLPLDSPFFNAIDSLLELAEYWFKENSYFIDFDKENSDFIDTINHKQQLRKKDDFFYRFSNLVMNQRSGNIPTESDCIHENEPEHPELDE